MTNCRGGYRMRKMDRVLFSFSTSPSKTTKELFLFQLEQDGSEHVVALCGLFSATVTLMYAERLKMDRRQSKKLSGCNLT
jgi:hypothetical protein